MIEIRPKCDPDGVFSVKRTCAELGVCHKTLRKLRRMGGGSGVVPWQG